MHTNEIRFLNFFKKKTVENWLYQMKLMLLITTTKIVFWDIIYKLCINILNRHVFAIVDVSVFVVGRCLFVCSNHLSIRGWIVSGNCSAWICHTIISHSGQNGRVSRSVATRCRAAAAHAQHLSRHYGAARRRQQTARRHQVHHHCAT